jgi:predicted ATP-grasp superfamily ATP-dependent carboligase
VKIFAFEYTSGGGLFEHPLPDSMLRQGAIMHRALISDLLAIADVEVITMRDARLPALDLPRSMRVVPVRGAGLCAACFDECVQGADAVWLVAPECGGILEYYSRKVLNSRRILLGCAADAVQLAASKCDTARWLAAAGIAVVATHASDATLPDCPGPWVVKPADGAACIDTRLFSGVQKALSWIAQQKAGAVRVVDVTGAANVANVADVADVADLAVPGDYVLQPFVAGQVCSLSLLCCDGAAQLLSCNVQRIAVRDNQFHFLGSTVNAIADVDGELARVARRIASAIPGLWGYVGVDVILTLQGIVVLEVNPRMTTSFAGLRAAIRRNPAQLVLDLLTTPLALVHPAFDAVVVSVDVDAFDIG